MGRIAVVLALLLLSVCAVSAEGLLQPNYRTYEANGGNVQQRSIIRGLLKRQYSCPSGYGYCTNRGQCCPLGGGCCNDGKCCPPGQFCSTPGHCCYNNQYICANRGCCYNSENCCRDGGCCNSGYYCVVGTDGRIGCCQNGKTCYGPAGGGGGGTTPPPTKAAPTSTTSPTSTPSSTTTSMSTPAAAPDPPPGFDKVTIDPNDPSISWSTGWKLEQSSCSSELSMKTTLTDQWMTYTTPANASTEVYFDFSWDSVSFNILIDGVKFSLTLTTKCQYYTIPITPGIPHNLTIFVSGPSTSDKHIESSSISGSFEFNKIVLGEKSSTTTDTTTDTTADTATSTTAGTATSTGFGQQNSADRTGPGGIIVAAGALLSATMFLI